MILTDKKEITRPCKDTNIFEGSQIIRLLEEELINSKEPGIGLAAPQIGVYKKVLIVRVKDKVDLINPVIIEQHDPIVFEGEGCLSFPGQSVNTLRYAEIFVKDVLHPSGIVCTGLEAVAVAHEIDHLNGITMFERIADEKV